MSALTHDELDIFDTYADEACHPERPMLWVVPDRPVRQGQLRLTQRGRVVVVLAGLAFALLVSFFLATSVSATQQPLQTRTVMVGTGDTLWDIASGVHGSGDVRDTMDQIKQLNHLAGSGLAAGQILRVPTSR